MNLECPSYLITGQPEETASLVNRMLKKQFCKEDCSGCSNCNKIEANSHHNIIWLKPEKSTYTKDQLEVIFQKCSFALEENEKFFFIISKAELLNASSSNSLLKIIEEPPAGFHFFFLTSRAQDILPTIKSRCVTKNLHSKAGAQHIELFNALIQEKIDPVKFLQVLEKSGITEKESIALIEELIAFWANAIKNKAKLSKETTREDQILNILTKSLIQPPMSGSSKVFWKNVVIQLSM